MKTSNKNKIHQAILFINSKKNIKYRNLVENDIFNININNDFNLNINDKIKSFRMQEEFGPKKRIKP